MCVDNPCRELWLLANFEFRNQSMRTMWLVLLLHYWGMKRLFLIFVYCLICFKGLFFILRLPDESLEVKIKSEVG
jgi:hypothetical protein